MREEPDGNIEARMSAVESDMANLIRSVDYMRKSIEDLGSRVSSATRTDWNVIAAWGTVTISVLSVIGYLAVSPINQMVVAHAHRVSEHHDEFVKHIQDGHPYRIEQKVDSNHDIVADVADDVSNLEENIFENQVRDISAHTENEERIRALERKVFGEVSNNNDGVH